MTNLIPWRRLFFTDALAVISLNTMHLDASNECIQLTVLFAFQCYAVWLFRAAHDDPGNQFEWLEDQLAMFRSRQM